MANRIYEVDVETLIIYQFELISSRITRNLNIYKVPNKLEQLLNSAVSSGFVVYSN